MTVEYKRARSRQPTGKGEGRQGRFGDGDTTGGRIFYGVDEKELADRRIPMVAGPICPLTDGTVDSRLGGCPAGQHSPAAAVSDAEIPVNASNGFVLVVEIYPAYASDLHMVTGFKESRFLQAWRAANSSDDRAGSTPKLHPYRSKPGRH